MKETNRELLIRIDERQQQVLNHLKELNGAVDANKTNVRRLALGVIIGSVVWIKESRDVIIGSIAALFKI